jgi:hypothetical protein
MRTLDLGQIALTRQQPCAVVLVSYIASQLRVITPLDLFRARRL